MIAEVNNSYKWDYDRPLSIGPIKDFYGHFLMMVRSHTYISELGREGLSKIGRHAILLANYIRARLTGHFHLSYDRACMHEVVFDDQFQLKNDISTLDIAKKIIDYGYHPPTIYFPLIIKGALMIEPTETESLETIDELSLIHISEPTRP